MGGEDASCDRDHSSIEGCVNVIWEHFHAFAILADSLKRTPDNPAGRIATLDKESAKLLPAILLLGRADHYDGIRIGVPCDATAAAIKSCERGLRIARHGIELLAKTQLVAALPPATRQGLNLAFRQREMQYAAPLDILAVSGQGDPSDLCNESYASVPSCERAVAEDSAALQQQVLPVYRCGRRIPGQFLTPQAAADDTEGGAAHPEPAPISGLFEENFPDMQSYIRYRLQKERSLLEQAKQERAGPAPDAQPASR